MRGLCHHPPLCKKSWACNWPQVLTFQICLFGRGDEKTTEKSLNQSQSGLRSSGNVNSRVLSKSKTAISFVLAGFGKSLSIQLQRLSAVGVKVAVRSMVEGGKKDAKLRTRVLDMHLCLKITWVHCDGVEAWE